MQLEITEKESVHIVIAQRMNNLPKFIIIIDSFDVFGHRSD